MTIKISYDKPKVIQALRYHFISRREIKIMLILVNVFAIVSTILFYMHKIQPLALIIASFLWFSLMLVFWFWLPRTIYKRNTTFRDNIDIDLQPTGMYLKTARGTAEWAYKKFAYFIESPHFFHLYINDKSFFLIPKEVCVGEADTVSVRRLLTEKIGLK